MKTSIAASAMLGALLVAGVASAQPGPPSASAQTHYAIGNQLYATGRYAEAAEEFDTAFRVSQRPELLFNLGRAREDAGQLDRALDAYLRFDAAGAPGYDRDALVMRITRVRQRIAERDAPPVVTPPPPVATPRPAVVVAAPSRSVAVPVALLSIGGAALLGAVPLWVSALGTFNDLDTRCPMRQCPTANDLDRRDGAQTRALVGDVLGSVGVATLIAGGVVLGLTLAKPSDSGQPSTPRVTGSCTSAGCTAGVAITF